nr:hypothetical protein [Ktedonobacteraceae bacterium]
MDERFTRLGHSLVTRGDTVATAREAEGGRSPPHRRGERNALARTA